MKVCRSCTWTLCRIRPSRREETRRVDFPGMTPSTSSAVSMRIIHGSEPWCGHWSAACGIGAPTRYSCLPKQSFTYRFSLVWKTKSNLERALFFAFGPFLDSCSRSKSDEKVIIPIRFWCKGRWQRRTSTTLGLGVFLPATWSWCLCSSWCGLEWSAGLSILVRDNTIVPDEMLSRTLNIGCQNRIPFLCVGL